MRTDVASPNALPPALAREREAVRAGEGQPHDGTIGGHLLRPLRSWWLPLTCRCFLGAEALRATSSPLAVQGERKGLRARPAPSVHAQSGYTLLEMLVVLGLLGLIAAVSMPLLRGGGETGLIERTAARLAGDLAAMRVVAKHNTVARLDIDLASNRYWGTPKLPPRPLPAGIPITVSAAGAGMATAQSASIQFFPDGSSGGGRITVGAGAQRQVLTVEPLTGLIRLRRLP
jgi:general secretion pathway protein H